MKPDDSTTPVVLDDDLLGLIDAARADAPSDHEVKALASRVAPLVGMAASSLGAGAAGGSAAIAGSASAGTATAAKVAAGGGLVGATAKVAGMSVAAKFVIAAVAVTSVGVVTTTVVQHRASVAAHNEAVRRDAEHVGEAHSRTASPVPPVAINTPASANAAPVESEIVQASPTFAPSTVPTPTHTAHRPTSLAQPVEHTAVDAPAVTPPQQPAPSEVALLTEAQQLLATDPTATLTVVNRHASLYAHGIHAQEREVLAIEALIRLGRVHEAEGRARTFFHDYPTSTHRRRIDVLLSGTASPKS